MNNKSTSIAEISVDNNSVTDSKLIAESFNEYFVNIGPSLASEAREEIPAQQMTHHHNPGPSIDTTFYFHHTNIVNIALALMKLKPKIPAKILRVSVDIIAPSLTYIFNLSLDTGIYVDDWKFINQKIDGNAKIIDQFLFSLL
jgi:hypothetical protein